jgi:Primase C terminal 2 (PriCT-2)
MSTMAKNDDHGSESIWAKPLTPKGQLEPEPLNLKAEPEYEPTEPETKSEVIQFPSSKKYLDPGTNIATLQLPLVRFPGVKLVIPEWERAFNGWTEFIAEIAPETAPLSGQKKHVQYYVSGQLKEAELKEGGCRQLGVKQGTVGKQRSSAHIASLGPVLFLDDDGDVFARERQLREFGVAAVIYSSFSYGLVKEGTTEPSLGGRIALCGNRSWSPEEHGAIFDGFNHLLGGGFDEHGRSPALCYGRHARRSEDAPCKRLIIEGHAFNVDLLLELGRSLRPQFDPTRFQKTVPERKYATSEELERMQLMGRVRPPDDYNEWMSGAAACKRAFPDDMDIAFECFDTWSARSSKYDGSETARKKFDAVPTEYKGQAIEVTLEMLHWRARRRAENVSRAVYFPQIEIAEAFKHLNPNENLAGGMICPKGGEPIPPGTVGPKDGLTALEYLLFCWSERALEGLKIPPNVLKEARELTQGRRERIDLGGRVLHIWNDGNIATGTDALGDAISTSDARLYSYDKANKVLVRLSLPASDPAAADRIRELHKYKGKPGDPDDPARGRGMRLIPMISADKPGLRAIIAQFVATKKRVKIGKVGNKNVYIEKICSFAFKGNADTLHEPDASVLDDLLRRVLPERAPEIRGIVSAPVMPNLPTSTAPKALLRPDADFLITELGLDTKTGWFLAPIGTIVDVSAEPTQEQVRAAADLLQEPWVDFSPVSPGGNLEPAVSLSVAIFGTMIAANRRALEKAPGVGIDSHAEGMASGKTLSAKLICIIATGEEPTPTVLSTNYDEQKKALITFLVTGNGALLIDNVPNGTRIDSAALASMMSSPKFMDRLLGANKDINANTQVMITINGNALNTASELATRLLKMRLDTGLERPQDRSSANFKIPDLIPWTIENRQRIVAAVHTIVRAYLQECRRCGGTPPEVAARRKVPGSRFDEVEVLRDAFLRAFPNLPDPFLGFEASTLSSAPLQEKKQVFHLLDRKMVETARKRAPAWVEARMESFRTEFFLRRGNMTPARRGQRWGAGKKPRAADVAWKDVAYRLRQRYARSEVRAGRIKFSSSDIIIETNEHDELQASLQAMLPREATLGAITLGRWLRAQLVDAPIDGLVMRSTQDRNGVSRFWVERAKDKKAR